MVQLQLTQSLTGFRALRFKNFALTATQHFPILAHAHQARPGESYGENASSVSRFDLSNATGPGLAAISMPEFADETLLLYTTISVLAEFHNRPKGFINRTSWPSERGAKPLVDMERTEWENQYFIPRLTAGSNRWVDIVLNNMDDKGHPFHLVNMVPHPLDDLGININAAWEQLLCSVYTQS